MGLAADLSSADKNDCEAAHRTAASMMRMMPPMRGSGNAILSDSTRPAGFHSREHREYSLLAWLPRRNIPKIIHATCHCRTRPYILHNTKERPAWIVLISTIMVFHRCDVGAAYE